MVDYEIIEHTADIGIRVKGKDLKAVFENSALAMFTLICQAISRPSDTKIKKTGFKIKQKAGDLEELLVNWLNELLSLSSAKGLIFTDFVIRKLDKDSLEAEVYGEDIKDYKVNTEIKAATYHRLKIQESDGIWQAEIIFDV
mgnify:CR=1 FL=1